MPSPLAVRRGHKFAVLAVPKPRARCEVQGLVPLGDTFAASTELPDGALDTWLDDIGRIHRAELSEQCLFLWATGDSLRPEVLDEENEALRESAYTLYLGLLLAVPYFSSDRLTSLTGANADGVARVRSLTTYAGTFRTLGAPHPALTIGRLRFAAKLAGQIGRHEVEYGRTGRFARALRTFREATEGGFVDHRLHQFVRCAEAFVVPHNAKQFSARLGRICAGPRARALDEMYRLRSGVEHLHGPYAKLPKRLSQRARDLRILQRCVEAEALARFLLVSFLLNEQMWAHVESRDGANGMWSLWGRAFRSLWPTRLHFGAVSAQFDVASVNARLDDRDRRAEKRPATGSNR